MRTSRKRPLMSSRICAVESRAVEMMPALCTASVALTCLSSTEMFTRAA